MSEGGIKRGVSGGGKGFTLASNPLSVKPKGTASMTKLSLSELTAYSRLLMDVLDGVEVRA